MEKVHRVIKFNQNPWLKPNIDMNTDLKKTKNDFKKDFFQLMSNAFFRKNMENVRKHKDIKLVKTEKKKKLIGVRTKLSHYKVFHRISVSNRNKKMEILINKPVYLILSILELSRILMYEFW